MLSLKSLLALLALFFAGLALWHNWRAHERAERLARETCRRMGVQLLDESVGQKQWRITRDEGRWVLRRVYVFEFSRNGSDRWPGELVLLGGKLVGVEFNLAAPPDGEPQTNRPAPPTIVPAGNGTAQRDDKVVPFRRDS
ncbi:MAG: DUF3301 domain-containing protein [Pseudomonadota bacterium]